MLINIGTFINRIDKRNIENKVDKVLGLNINKDFMPTVANIQNIDISKYKLVEPDTFVFSGMQTGRDNTIRIGLNDTLETFVVSPAYTTFVVNEDIILPKYFYMIFLSSERDRLGSFLSDSSVRANLDWDRFCEIEFEIPSLEIQQKYVDVYNALVANQKAYENGLDDLKFVCDGYLEQLKILDDVKPIGSFINGRNEKNQESKILRVRGLSSVEKSFIKPKRNINKNTLHNYNVVYPNDIAYRPVVTGYDDSLCIALSKESKNVVISPIYPVFYVKDTNKLLADYLFMWLSKSAFDKYAWYHSTGSARETLDFEILSEYKIPIPHIKVQQSIVDIYKVYETRKEINEKLKQQIKEICPVLIKGAIQESKGVI